MCTLESTNLFLLLLQFQLQLPSFVVQELGFAFGASFSFFCILFDELCRNPCSDLHSNCGIFMHERHGKGVDPSTSYEVSCSLLFQHLNKYFVGEFSERDIFLLPRKVLRIEIELLGNRSKKVRTHDLPLD